MIRTWWLNQLNKPLFISELSYPQNPMFPQCVNDQENHNMCQLYIYSSLHQKGNTLQNCAISISTDLQYKKIHIFISLFIDQQLYKNTVKFNSKHNVTAQLPVSTDI